MVRNITNFSRSGLSDWLIQRVSALVLIAYVIIMVVFALNHPQFQYADWRSLFSQTWMRLASMLTLLSLLSHAWIGMWTVSTDYLKCVYMRVTIQVIIILALLACLIWGIQILWSV